MDTSGGSVHPLIVLAVKAATHYCLATAIQASHQIFCVPNTQTSSCTSLFLKETVSLTESMDTCMSVTAVLTSVCH